MNAVWGYIPKTGGRDRDMVVGVYPQLLICAQKIGDSDRGSDSDGDIPELVVYPSLVACALSLPYPPTLLGAISPDGV
jgi:hypothetical protein